MICYESLSNAMDVLFGICALLLMAGVVYILVKVCAMRLKGWYLPSAIALAVIASLVLQGIGEVSNCKNNVFSQGALARLMGQLPIAVVILLLVVLAAMETVFFLKLRSLRGRILTPTSVKESLDALPDGICFYTAGGQPLLVNTQMNCISAEMFGTVLLNAETFWRRLQNGEGNAIFLRTEPSVCVRTEDTKVWDFRIKTLTIKNGEVQELIACDMTTLYRLSEELDARNAGLKRVNERLRRYSREVERNTLDNELLNAKIRVHDDVGQSLLAFRAYLEQPQQERNRDKLLFFWRQTVAVLKNEASSVKQRSDWELLCKAAQSVDVQIVQDGELPESKHERAIIIAAMHECLTNTVKHAKGNELRLHLSADEMQFTAVLTNNGSAPVGAIRETGGLKNLRRKVETAGGSMTIEAAPRFLLRIALPRGVD